MLEDGDLGCGDLVDALANECYSLVSNSVVSLS